MNENLKEFLTHMGILTEFWMVTYNSFVAQGMSADDAAFHTRNMVTAIMQGFGR